MPSYTTNSLVLTAVQGGSGSWRFDSDGLISLPASWTGGLPGAAGDVAVFGPVITQPRTVIIDQPTTLGQIVLDSPQGYTLAGAPSGSGSNTLTLDNSGSTLAGYPLAGRGAAITVNNGWHVIAAPVVLADNLVVESGGSLAGYPLAGAGPWTLALGNLNGISETGGSRSLTMNGSGGTLILSGTDTYSGGTIVAAGTLVLASGAAVLDGSSLVIGAGGTLIFDPTVATEPALGVDVGATASPDSALTGDAGAASALDAALFESPGPVMKAAAPLASPAESLSAPVAVPEPATLLLAAIAACVGLMAGVARRHVSESSGDKTSGDD